MGRLTQVVCVVTVFVCITVNMTNAQAGTLGFNLNGVAYPDGATVLRTDIGEGDNALQCTTDSTTCCRNIDGESRAGDFYMPDGNLVLILSTTVNGYYRTRGSRHILLNRQPTGTITGQFRCNIPRLSGPGVDLYINIVDMLATITLSGDNIAGDTFSLVCSTVTGSNVTWLDPTDAAVPSEMISIMGDVHTLTFNPLAASDAGTYTCRAMLGDTVETAEMTVTVQSPKIMVTVGGDVIPTVEMMLTLTCSVIGDEMITDRTVTYQWSRNGMVMSEQTQQTWSFSSLAYSDAGQYSCAVNVSSNILPNTISAVSDLFNVTISLPDPSRVTVMSDLGSLVTSGVDVTLTCTVELNSDLASVSTISVTITWTGPSGMLSSGSVPMMMGNSPPTYTSTLVLSAVMSVDDGDYTCQATTISSSPYLFSSGAISNSITVSVEAPSTVTPTTTMETTNVSTTETQTVTTAATTTEVTMPTVETPAISITVTSSGINTAGEIYCLVCSVSVTGSTDQPTITWMDPMNNQITSGVVTSGSMSTLTFNQLGASDAGTYSCTTTLGNASQSSMLIVTVDNPSIVVGITANVATPIVGSMYSLTCAVTGADRLTDAMVTYQWFKNGAVVLNQTMATLSFQSLVVSDAGTFTCQATVNSSLLSEPITTSSASPFNVTLSLPNPTIMITSTPVSPIRPIGSNVTLICTVELSSAVDVPVTVNFQLTAPSGSPQTTTPPSVSGLTYTTTAMINSFGRNQSGVYTCTATVDLVTANPFIIGGVGINGMGAIGTGVYLSLSGVVYANNSAIQITEIGQTNPDNDLNEGLQCITDRMPCCRVAFRTGEWFMYTPDRTMVPGPSTTVSFYRNRGYDDGTVNLNRNAGVMSPTGLFCCEVPDAAGDIQPVCANIVSIGVTITSTGISITGETYSLDCSVTGTSDPATYQWFHSNGTLLKNTSQLQFSPLLASQAGTYTCRATVGSVVVENSNTVGVTFPAPTAVTVTPPVDAIIAGSKSLSLTCTVELSLAVDVPVTVNTMWSGPDVIFMPASSVPGVMVNTTTYTSTVTVDAAKNGSYTCRAIVTSGGTASGSTDVTVAPLPAPTSLRASSSTPTSITLTWQQLEGANAVERYDIDYSTVIQDCVGNFPPVTVSVDNSSLSGYTYTLSNSADSPVEEYSLFRISLTAVNSVTRSVPSQFAMTATAEAAPGSVQSLTVSSVSVASITIQWGRVNCQERNGRVDGYRVAYYPTFSSNIMGDQVARRLIGTDDNDRVLSANGLAPRTSYTFDIQASNPNINARGPIAFITANTTAPQDLSFLLGGQLYPNNSIVTVTDIGSSLFMSALFCLTPSLECCSDSETPNAASVTREWYLPDGRPVTSANSPFIKSQVSSAVSLHRDPFNFNPPPSSSGMYRCEIPDASGTSQSIYVGIYPQGDGSPSITSLTFDRNSTILNCTSTGGPPTTVTWMVDGTPVNSSLYEQSQRLVDAKEATYENILFNNDVANFVGTFTCEVSNARLTNPVRETLELNGVFIVRDQFTVGQSVTASCKSDTPATRIEWLRDGVVVESDNTAGIQELDLVFSPVNDTIHNQVYVCRVTRGKDGMPPEIAVQNFTMNVDVPTTVVTATVSSSGLARAGMIYNLTCTVSKTRGGLINFPTTTWTDVSTGMAVTNGNGITVSTMTTDAANISTLTFDPLRTSHVNTYSCDGTLTSPALDTPLMPFTVETVHVQISTPNVVITVPPGPLFAGSIAPLTLICNISINSATDTDVAIMDTDVTWLNGSTPLFDGDARVTISAVSGSRPSFTSTLTLDPLSTEDNTTFTCMARARPANALSFITASEMGELATSVVVNLPSPPVVRINPFNSVALAGESLTVNCSVIPQEGIMYNNNTLSVLWSMGGGTPLPMEEDSGAMIFISSVRTSHGGRYNCTARLYIPEARVDISGTNTTAINVQIPIPTLTITGSPRNSGFFRGLILTFTCQIEIDSSVDTGVTVEASWERNGTLLEDSSDRQITVISTGLVESPYETGIRFNATDFEDAGRYNCSARIIPRMSEFILEQTGFVTRTITVLNFPPQDVSVVDEGVSTAGYSGYTLVCTTDRDADLNPTSTLTIQWLDSDGNMISSGDDFSISGTQGPVSDVSITSRLTFNSLVTSQAGLYTCRTLLTIPGTVDNHVMEDNFTVNVTLPTPEVVTIYESRSAPIYEGTMFSLTCVITPNMTGVDTGITIERNFTGPRTSDANRVTAEDTQFQTTLTFRPVAMTDGGRYVCSASAISTSQYPNVKDSVTTMNDSTISIAMLPPPVVMISAPPTPTGGQSYTLDCSARTEDYVISVPSVEWVNIGSTDSRITQPPQTNGAVSANRSLTFNPIRTSHGDSYTCQASVNIPLANISDRSNTDSQDVRVLIPTSVVMVNKGDFQPYNGTVFNLTGVLQLVSNIVDTDVTVMWVWSLNGRELDTQTTSASPHEITISFNPLATNSSGLYSLNLTIMPNNLQYVGGNSDSSTTYNLNVLSLPAPVLSIAITSRVADRCSEAMTFTCTATTVDNLFTPPRIEWRYDGNVVPDSGNPQMNSTTGQLIFSSIMSENSGDYTCRAIVSIQESGIDNRYSTSTAISTDMPAKVENLMCVGDSGDMSLTISWGKPMAQGSGVVGYSVEAQKVEQLSSRELRSVPLSPAYDVGVEETRAQVTQELESETPYNITVKALNLAGCGEEQQIFCFTEEGRPPIPQNVTVVRINDTALMISWYKFTLVELKGLAMYIITYTVSGGSRKRQTNQMVTAMWFENNKTIGGLPPRQAVSLQVYTSSSGGISDETVRMLEAVPTDDGMAVIVGAIIAVILAILAVVITMIIIVILVRRYRVSRKFSPRHNMYDVSSKSEERELQLHPIDNGSSQPAMNDKEKEALEESAIVPPPTQPRSAITTEVMDRMKPVSMTSFRDHVAARHEDRDKGFESEYQSFGTDPVNSHEIAKLPINRPKNRFANIFPYDHSRVELNELPGEEGSDYINACSLGGYKRKECYIAAQGPMPNTISDFWRMVWEKRLPNIVMLTKCLEAGRRKCEQYWADNIGEDYQTPDKKLNITTTSVMPYADFVIRTFSVKSLTNASLDPLSVTHYHFTSWPDHGVPKFATSLISFIRRVQRGHTKDSGRQLLVHCSAGVGRTGTLITLDSMLDRMAAKEPDVNVYEFVYHMRQRRVLMVQTLAQYVFIHDALNELITCGQTDIVASALRTKVNFLSKVIPAKGITGFQNQFQLLEQVSRLPVDEDLTDAMEPYNQSKNRYPDKIPYNMSRARLRPTGEDGSEYINASFIDGYKQRNAYIATQGPLQHTVNDIWRMLYEFKSRTLVMLCNMNEDGSESSYPYFPSKEEEAVKYGKMVVTLQSKASYTDFIVRKFSIHEDKQGSPKNDGFVVTQFHLTEWPLHQVPNTGTLIEMLDMVTKNQMSTGNRPITVMCNDGVGRTGTFICIHAQLERLKTEGVVDFFQSIKSARIQRAGLVPDVDQYAFCHTVLADYIDKFDNYANFKDMI